MNTDWEIILVQTADNFLTSLTFSLRYWNIGIKKVKGERMIEITVPFMKFTVGWHSE